MKYKYYQIIGTKRVLMATLEADKLTTADSIFENQYKIDPTISGIVVQLVREHQKWRKNDSLD